MSLIEQSRENRIREAAHDREAAFDALTAQCHGDMTPFVDGKLLCARLDAALDRVSADLFKNQFLPARSHL